MLRRLEPSLNGLCRKKTTSRLVRSSAKSTPRANHPEVSRLLFGQLNWRALGEKESAGPKSAPKEPNEPSEPEKQEQPAPEESRQPEAAKKEESKPREQKAAPSLEHTPPKTESAAKPPPPPPPPPPSPSSTPAPFNRDERRVYLLSEVIYSVRTNPSVGEDEPHATKDR